MVAAGRFFGSIASTVFQYNTPRVVVVRSRCIGLVYRLIQLPILIYLIGYIFIHKQAYQEFETLESSVLTKLKGILVARDFAHRVWDSTDISILPQETTSFFIPTNYLFTPHQSRKTCPEDPFLATPGVFCLHDSHCAAGKPTMYGNGIRTGRCVPVGSNISTCEITGWCPTELDVQPNENLLTGFESVTVLIKNHIAFAKFDIKRRNILFFEEERMLNCRYDPINDPLCPVFSLLDMIRLAKENMSEIAYRGGVIGFNIEWKCNLDYSEEYCLPVYDFKRLDNQHDVVAKGWNFRQANYWHDVFGNRKRDLIKFYGIRFVFNVTGRAGRFSAVMFFMNLGASVGLLGIASLISDFVLIRIFGSDESLMAQKYIRLDNPRRHRPKNRQNIHEDYCYYSTYQYTNPPSCVILADNV